ncbi:hypothetical protein EAF04_007165 [Stromatinia cepivora]|nr:hypothetical protein EAF04_007165 [Stromatinia cepivora]
MFTPTSLVTGESITTSIENQTLSNQALHPPPIKYCTCTFSIPKPTWLAFLLVTLFYLATMYLYYGGFDYVHVYHTGYFRAWRNAEIATKYRIMQKLELSKECDRDMLMSKMMKEWDTEINNYLPDFDDKVGREALVDACHEV